MVETTPTYHHHPHGHSATGPSSLQSRVRAESSHCCGPCYLRSCCQSTLGSTERETDRPTFLLSGPNSSRHRPDLAETYSEPRFAVRNILAFLLRVLLQQVSVLRWQVTAASGDEKIKVLFVCLGEPRLASITLSHHRSQISPGVRVF